MAQGAKYLSDQDDKIPTKDYEYLGALHALTKTLHYKSLRATLIVLPEG